MPLDDSTLDRLRGDTDRKESLPARLAFGDSDLKTPQHDEILLWLQERLPQLVDELTDGRRTLRKSIWEFALNDGRFVAGFIDLVAVVGSPSDTWRGGAFAFEIKSSIKSLGELVRQLRFYEAKFTVHRIADQQVQNTRFAVVSPDGRWRNALASQGFIFIAYPSGEITMPEREK